MNKISEIIEKKQRKTMTEEKIYKTYISEKCKKCKNKKNTKDLCRITITKDKQARCLNYERCMKNKCKTCKNVVLCNNQ